MYKGEIFMWHTLSIGEVVSKLRTDLNTGLSEKQASEIRNKV